MGVRPSCDSTTASPTGGANMGDVGGAAEPLLVDIDRASRAAEERFEGGPVGGRELAGLAGWESKNLWRLSWASIVVQVFNFTLSLVTQMFVGHLGAVALAGVSIANVGIQGLALGIMLGMASAVQTVCGQAFGAKKYGIMGVVLQRALILHLAAAVALGFVYWFSGSLFRLVRQSEEVSAIGQRYARGLVLQLLAYALYLPMQRFLQAQNIINPIAYLALAVFFFHLLLSWVVMSLLKCGILGAALSLGFSWWVLVICTWLYIVLSPSCRQTWTGLSIRAFTGLWPYLKLTVASAVMLCLEVWYNQGIVLLTGFLPNPEISLDSISIITNYLAWDMMIMLGLSNAGSVRIGNELGAAHPRVAKFAVVVMLATCLVVNTVIALIVLIFRVALSKLYTSSDEVVSMVSNLMPLLSISIFLNGIQPILSGVAIGSGWQAIVAYVNVGAYYFIGLPIGCVLGFKTSLGVAGIWWGMIIGVFVQTVTLIIITARTNWNREVEKAVERLKRAGEEDPLTKVGLDEEI
uniref:Protein DETOXIFICATION n=1 Tax=Anthurium amnicola TaxID=1678845 RepID=A0A1D1XK81_9ARAE